MKKFYHELRISLLALLSFTLLLGIVYPLFVWGVSQVLFHGKSQGSLIYNEFGDPIGSKLIAQNFSKPEYFHPRPSSAGDHGYDATSSSGSNLGPTSKKLIDALRVRASSYRDENGLPEGAILPADAVTGSGSGLDPHISIENAHLQAPRVAAARNSTVEFVQVLLDEVVESPFLGLFGEKRVNVLLINRLLDQRSSSQ
jgi:K+-transporting ATPase ATPase C chain